MPRAKTPRNGDSRNGKAVAASRTEFPAGQSTALPTDIENEIRLRAYELYVERGYEPGHEAEDWITAEKEIVARHSLLSM
jgi:Protein of unknown function (DUF2934)